MELSPQDAASVTQDAMGNCPKGHQVKLASSVPHKARHVASSGSKGVYRGAEAGSFCTKNP